MDIAVVDDEEVIRHQIHGLITLPFLLFNLFPYLLVHPAYRNNIPPQLGRRLFRRAGYPTSLQCKKISRRIFRLDLVFLHMKYAFRSILYAFHSLYPQRTEGEP